MYLVAWFLEIVRQPSGKRAFKSYLCFPQTDQNVLIIGSYYCKVEPKWLEIVL